MDRNLITVKKKGKTFNHACEHYQDLDVLEDIMPGNTFWARFRRSIMSMFLVSSTNYRTFGYLRSKMAIEQEKSRHLRIYFYTIHPFSSFRMWWEVLLIVSVYVNVMLNPVHSVWLKHEPVVNLIIVFGNAITFVDCILNCVTGVANRDTRHIEMHRSSICWSYVKGAFIVDAIASFPFAILYTRENDIFIKGKRHVQLLSWWRFLSLLKVLKVTRLIIYYQNTVKAFNLSYSVSKIYSVLIFSSVVMHVIACSYFYVVSLAYQYFNGNLTQGSWIMNITQLDMDMFGEYIRILLRVIAITRQICFNYYEDAGMEQLTSIVLIIGGQVFFFCLIAEVMHITKIHSASSSKYEEMIVQLTQFMNHKRLPTTTIHRILEFYNFKFHKNYYVEAEIMNSLSEQIKQDVIIHNCRNLVERVKFFANLPNDLKLRIVTCMRTAYYLSGDIIIDLNGTGDCMYFIKSGTVGVYSSTGKEICHLEDGDNFGEISLLLENVNRVASVIALESCELLLLERVYFLNAVEPYPEVYASLKRVAERRLKQTQKLDADDSDIVTGF